MFSDLVKQFFPNSQLYKVLPFGNGHINDTYKLELAGVSDSFIIQRINSTVFSNPQGIVDNHLRLQRTIFQDDTTIAIPKIAPNAQGSFLTYDNDGNAWRLTEFINNSYTINLVEEDWQAYEAGFAFGWFVNVCANLNPCDFHEAIKNFHRLSYRINQLNQAVNENIADRINLAKDLISFYKQREEKLSIIANLADKGEFPLRVVHNDTKINNLLFREKKAVAVIDLDTLGPGILYNDYGDAIRTFANTAKEDEKDLAKVNLNLNAFSNFSKGYFAQAKTIVNETEKKYFYLAPVLLTYIMGIRFLTDYLNGDIYYKTSYPEHNLDRSLVQMALIESMEMHEDEMKTIIDNLLK